VQVDDSRTSLPGSKGARPADPRGTLVRSRFLSRVPAADAAVLSHSLYGTSLVLNAEAESLLELFARPSSVDDVLGEGSPQLLDVVRVFLAKQFLVSPDRDEREEFARGLRPDLVSSGAHLSELILLVSEQCNLACKYCMKDKIMGLRRERPQARMSLETAIQAVDAFLEVVGRHRRTDLLLELRGGESLLAPEVAFGAVRHMRSRWTKGAVSAWMVTNGTLVTNEIARELAELKMSVALSLDGPRHVHDRLRRAKDGQPTYDCVLTGLHRLLRAGLDTISVNTTVTSGTFADIGAEYVEELAALGIRRLNLEPDLLEPAHPSPTVLAKRILTLRACGRAHGVEVSGCWARPFENLRAVVRGEPLPSGGASCLVVDAHGLVVGSEYNAAREFGPAADLATVLASEPYRRAAEASMPGRIPECLGCELEGPCQGNASLSLFYEKATGREGLFAHRCRFIRAMTRGLLAELAGSSTTRSPGRSASGRH
jgi:sulfatase maturation enzyme AslB (radical SAM superfamily)